MSEAVVLEPKRSESSSSAGRRNLHSTRECQDYVNGNSAPKGGFAQIAVSIRNLLEIGPFRSQKPVAKSLKTFR